MHALDEEGVMLVRGNLFFIAAALLFVASMFVGAFTTATEWAVPLFVGAIASLLAGFYQRWWVQSVFEAPPRRREVPARVPRRRISARIRP